jgi:ATP-dependent RNA helicase DeaD
MERFRKLNLSKPFLETIKGLCFEIPSEIQEKTIPLTLEGKDVIAGSATGSGKTLAFGACIIEKLHIGGGLQSLILTPTRELAEQVSEALQSFSRHKNLKIISVYGGVGIEPQIKNLRDADVVVGTPGRILDHLERFTINLSKIKILVLDEADRMLDMGFLEDVEKIIEKCNRNRQTLLFSATISPEIALIAKKYMRDAVEVSAESQVDPSKLTQVYYDVDSGIKFSALVHLLKEEKSNLVLVFCNTRHNADFVTRNLRNNEIDAKVIHGGLSQNKRSDVLDQFHEGKVLVLVCTDVAARGLDIKGVSHVYNYDIPKTSKDYIHRIGRTARAGKEGKAISILSQRDYENFQNVLKDDAIKLERLELPYVEKANISLGREDRGRSFGGRDGASRGGYGERRGFSRSNSGFRGRDSRYGERSFGERRSFGSGGGFSRGRDDRRSFSRGFRGRRY